MSPFDPYLNWLGIPAHEQPPNFYRLLGIVLFESNPQVIEQAADRQSLAVGAYQAGRRASFANGCWAKSRWPEYNLLDPQQKAGYDAYLQQTLAHRGERAVAAPPPPSIIGAAAPRAMRRENCRRPLCSGRGTRRCLPCRSRRCRKAPCRSRRCSCRRCPSRRPGRQ